MGLIEDCGEHYGTKSLYEVLGVPNKANLKQVKKAYYNAAMKIHPDRVPEGKKLASTKLFQILGKVYDVLQDKEKRAIYDDTGEVGDELVTDGWTDYFAKLFKVDSESILKFTKEYQKSEEEKNDLKTLYVKFEGDMTQIMNNHLCCTFEDEGRISEMLNEMIQAGDVPTFKAFISESKSKKSARRKKALKEAKEAEEHAANLGVSVNGSEDLIKAIKAGGQKRGNFLDSLEAKYQPRPTRSKRKK